MIYRASSAIYQLVDLGKLHYIMEPPHKMRHVKQVSTNNDNHNATINNS